MKFFKILLFCLIPVLINAQMIDQNFLITSGIDAGVDKGDSLNRAGFIVDVPAAYPGKIYFRIFDADLGDSFDNPGQKSETRYLVFGQGSIDRNVFSINDSIDVNKALVNLVLDADKYYDNRWRTIGSLTTVQGQKLGDRVLFQLLVDGISGSGRNHYQLFISADDKRNEKIDGAEIYSPALALRLASNVKMATQISFTIPDDCDTIVIYNFDADLVRSPNIIKFETNFRTSIKVPQSSDGGLEVKKIVVLNEEQGRKASLVIEDNAATNNIQVWITDNKGQILFLDYPPRLALKNHLPLPKFKVIPLAECNSLILDATESSDADGDELIFKWYFAGGEFEEGIRIVHDFKKPGNHPVKLLVIDNSIFVANTARLTQTVIVNDPPNAVIEGTIKAAPYQTILFDGSKSFD
ncbi:PKD domain-containing protein, partial [bacterium]|nr:PKD domain-containing protein [bacterium]